MHLYLMALGNVPPYRKCDWLVPINVQFKMNYECHKSIKIKNIYNNLGLVIRGVKSEGHVYCTSSLTNN